MYEFFVYWQYECIFVTICSLDEEIQIENEFSFLNFVGSFDLQFQVQTAMNRNEDHFHFLSEIFNSDTSERHAAKEEARFSTLELLPQQRNETVLPSVSRPQVCVLSSKWLESEKKDYLKFYLREFIHRPFLCISWKYWKPDQTLPRMAHFIKTKNMKQCKSYDERMKQESFDKRGMDISRYVTQEIKKYADKDPEISEMLKQYEEVKLIKSSHMAVLQQESQLLKSVSERLESLMQF